MKLTKSKKRNLLLTGVAALALCASAAFAVNTISARAEENTAGLTLVPDSELVQLSDDSEVMFFAKKTGYPVMRFTATGSYTLKDVTDIAIRVKNAGRQVNDPNSSGGLCYIQFKFKNNDTIWNLKNENYILGSDGTTKLYTHYTMLYNNGRISRMVGTATGGTAEKGGMLAVTAGMDGTLYIPLTMIYKDGGLTDADRITALEGYQDLELEYIEFEYSAYRWDIIIGDIATVAKKDDDYVETPMSFDKAAQNDLGLLLTDIYDDVSIVVNGTEGVKGEDGKVTATVDGMGSVSVASDELRFFTKASVTSDLQPGYGITSVITEMYKGTQLIDSVTANPVSSGYVLSGNFDFRTDKPENTDVVGTDPVKCVIKATVSPLAKLNVTGEAAGVSVAYGSVDTSDNDNVVYLPKNEKVTVSVTPKSGFTFTGVKLGGTELTNVATEAGKYSYEVTVAEADDLEIVGAGEPVDLGVELAQDLKASVSIGDTAFTANATYSTNLRKTLSLKVVPNAGYAAKVEKVVAAAEAGGEATVTELTAGADNLYAVVVDGAFTLRISSSIVNYTVTYRLNNGAYAEGESNPETVTVLDAITLKTPTREGYTFLGWEIQGEEGYVTELKNVSSDITVVAKWERQAASGDNGGESEENGCKATLAGGVAVGITMLGAAVVCMLKKKEN